MEENLYYTELYDLYTSLLTDRQRLYFESYYFENLTLEEISENEKITKSAVSKEIKNVKQLLESYESKLKLHKKRELIEKEFENEKDILSRIHKYDNIIM